MIQPPGSFIDSPINLISNLMEIYQAQETGKPFHISRDGIERYSRAHLTTQLADVLSKVTGRRVNQNTADG